jgi:hypothetical protein
VSARQGVLVASQVAVGRLNDLRIRVFGERGALEWHQETPNTLRFDALDGPTQTYHRGDGGLCAEAQAAIRIPSGHPEGFYEAFGNIYRGARAAILGETQADRLPDARRRRPRRAVHPRRDRPGAGRHGVDRALTRRRARACPLQFSHDLRVQPAHAATATRGVTTMPA